MQIDATGSKPVARVAVPGPPSVQVMPAKFVRLNIISPESQIVVKGARGRVGKVSAPGTQGPRGEPGRSVFRAVAGENLSALRAVVFSDDQLILARPAEQVQAIAGVVITAANEGSSAEYQAWGVIEDDALGLTPDAPVFLGESGSLTQNPGPYAVPIGRAIRSDALAITIQLPIEDKTNG